MTTTLDCREAMRQLFDFLDEELTPDRMEAVRAHIDVCARCYPHYDFERAFLFAIAATRRDQPASGELRLRVTDALRREGLLAET